MTRNELTALIRTGRPVTGLRIQELDLSTMNLAGALFEQVHFSKVNLQGADLRQTVWRESSICGSDLQGADCSGMRAKKLDFSGSNLGP